MEVPTPEAAFADTQPSVPPGPPMPPPRRGGRRAFGVLGLIAVVVVGGILLARWLGRDTESTDDAQIDADVVTVTAQVGGEVLEVLVRENQAVDEGQVLARIDPAQPTARLASARAELASAEAAVLAAEAQVQLTRAGATGGHQTAEAGVTGARANVATAQSQEREAKAALDRAETEAAQRALDLRRQEALVAEGASAQATLDRARTLHEEAVAALAQARAGAAAATDAASGAKAGVREAAGRLEQTAPAAQIDVAEAQVAVARARVEVARAAVDTAKLDVEHTTVVAPDGGVVTNLAVVVGDVLQKGQPVTAIVPPEVYVVAAFKETQIGRMRPGQPATIEVDAFPELELHGRVQGVSAGTGARFSLLPPDNATGNFVKVVQRVPVRIALIDPPQDVPLRAGLSVTATVDVGGEPDAAPITNAPTDTDTDGARAAR